MSKICPLCEGVGSLSLPEQRDKYSEAHSLRQRGLSYRQIAKTMGLNHASQSKHYVDQYNKNKRETWLSRLVSHRFLAFILSKVCGVSK